MRLVSKFLVGIVSARILGPTNFGFYNLIDLVSKYGPLSNMGVSSGISREIPLNLGMGKEEYVEELNDAGFTGLLSTTSFIAALFIVYSFIFLKGLALFAVVMASAGVVFNAVYEYDIMYLYAHSRFRIASRFVNEPTHAWPVAVHRTAKTPQGGFRSLNFRLASFRVTGSIIG